MLIDNARGTQTAESADECDTSRNGGTGDGCPAVDVSEIGDVMRVSLGGPVLVC